MADRNSPSKNEEDSRLQFDAWLEAHEPASPAWEVPPSDPPDYFLTLSGTRFAVEVTSIVETLPVGAIESPIQEVGDIVVKFIKRIHDEATKQGILRGIYVLAFADDLRNFGNKKAQANLRNKILTHIAQSHGLV